VHADLGERVFDFLQLEVTNDGFNLFHRFDPVC
jgi:hypothetical protein